MATTQLKDGRWICYWRIKDPDGKSRIKKEYFGRGPDGEAAAKKRDGELGLLKRKPRQSKSGPAFGELAQSYALNKNFSDNSRYHLLLRLQANLLPYFGDKAAIKLSDRDLDKYVWKRRSDGVKDSTISRELTDLKAILNWSAARRPPLIPFNPVHAYKKPESDDEIIIPPTLEETSRILKHASAHVVRAIKLSYYLGLRPGAVELFSLDWRNVNFETLTIRVISAHKGGPQSRQVPIHESFKQELRTWYEADKETGPIIHFRGKPIRSLKRAWKAALKRAGITRRIRPYDLRHNFVTRALEGGGDLKALSEIVGSRPEILMRHYQHVTTKVHRDTISKVPPLE